MNALMSIKTAKKITRREVKPITCDRQLNEIYTDGLHMFLLNNEFKGIHPPVLCKDFITDVIWAQITKKPAAIYGFHVKPDMYDITRKWHYLAMIPYENDAYNINRANIETLLSDFERALNIPQTTTRIVGNYIVVKFHRIWLKKPYMVSLFTLLCRIAFSVKCTVKELLAKPELINNVVSSTDRMYFKSPGLEFKLKTLLSGKYLTVDKKDQYDFYPCIASIHNQSGIINV